MAKPATRFVLKRLNWAESYDGTMERQPGARNVASFDTFDAADAERVTRENACREVVNPFACGAGVYFWTHLDEPRLRDWLMDHGVDPPNPKKGGATDWAGWWKKGHAKLSAEKRHAVWEALDKVRFYAVVEEPVRPVGYAVVHINWQYNDETYDAHPDQSEVMQVFRTRERAEKECADSNDIARDLWADIVDESDEFAGDYETEDEYAMFDMRDRVRRQRGLLGSQKLNKGEGVFRLVKDTPFYEVIEVPLEGLE
ncbi:hypothetical protein GobsT_75700 [Gemmata obscuriglobus]|uniref:Uncharacterized protein n=1 Tax=Gemmata obscuriglobus TaxID=114 RepID=A0A2Z3H5U6_9BACT|nr:hypothetical protein [Gemmata obscuriglobus]AWM41393.1 hypothetical protein C1280_33255 [Gemmata obscuriglobus]QEG32711.1 hypothetical protein GobsT_75700 [Gemmata obscuriglobus]VTS12069.1 unnamed protein product [Gemmata obscuriglobus UQM 2246]